MMQLEQILKDIATIAWHGNRNISIGSVVFDSRQVTKDSVFVAVRGVQTDGHLFIEKAKALGAAAIVCEAIESEQIGDTTVVVVKDAAEALGKMSANFFGRPSEQLKLVGVTGTNGKTTCATLLHQLYTALGFKAGLLSTVENRIGTVVVPSTHTTPDPVQLNKLLQDMVSAGCDYAFMEVSSHAVQQRRIAGLHFVGAMFTNLTHDHLDYHGTFANYLKAKKLFFDELPKEAFSLINIDDRNGKVMVQNTASSVSTYSLRKPSDFKAKIIENGLLGLHLQLDGQAFFARLRGEFNAYNLAAVYGTAKLLGADAIEVLTILSNLAGAEGRFETVFNAQKQVTGIVDYAHTPDALEKVLETIRDLKQGGKVITVVGCGGDRDSAKRPIMAKIAAQMSQIVILTSDNPRSEDPAAIIAQMEAGIPENTSATCLSIENRQQAIKTACKLAQRGDIVLVAGKGHEKYQDIKGVKHPFDDKEILTEALGM